MEADKNQKVISEIQNIVFEMATNIFNNITPEEQKSNVTQKDVSYVLNNLTSAINSKTAFSYLKENDGYYVRRLSGAIEEGMKNIFKDSKITITDVPAVLKMISEITLAFNNIHEKMYAITQISRHTFIPLVQTIILLTCQMMLSEMEFEAAKNIVIYGFKLIQTELLPLYNNSKKEWWCCGGKIN